VREVSGAVRGDHLGMSGYRRLLTRIEEFPKPVIAAIDGVCTAGGIELALSCDLRVAADTAQISDLHVTTTAHTGGAGATSRLSRLVGPAKAKEMIFLGLVLNGAEAHRIGFANRVVPSASLIDEVTTMGAEIAKRHPIALRMAKALADAASDLDHDRALRYDHLGWTAQMMTTGGYAGAQRFAAR
jgi:enoyl-CoA hydratase